MENLYIKVEDLFNQNYRVAHGIDHVNRVAALAKYIASNENYDETEAEVAAMLHDVGRTVQNQEIGHGPAGVPVASKLLDKYTNYDEMTKSRILDAVKNHSCLNTVGELTHIVQDADMLDGLGAVGIMRAYTYKASQTNAGAKNMASLASKPDNSELSYQMNWVNLLHTPTAKKLAAKRYNFMKEFIKEYNDEAQGLDLR